MTLIAKETYKWYPVYTNPRAEKKAYEALARKGIETYLPLNRQLRQWLDRKKWVEEPLIKSYLFVKIGERQQTEVLMTNGVCRFIYFSGKIASMPDRQIDDLKLLMANSSELEITAENLAPGEKVRIKAGPLKGLRGEVTDFRSQKQLTVRLDQLGYSIVIYVAAVLLERL
ncbi:MAG: UpxY family transcription antiterminator [Bacteroidota bacterium]